MPKFGIYSPTMGKREDFPVILLDKSITPECMNVQIEDGEIKTAQMRENLFSGNGIGIPILKHYYDSVGGSFWFSISNDFLTTFDGNKFYIAFYYSYYDATTGLYTNYAETPRFFTGTGLTFAEYNDVVYANVVPAGVKSASDSDRIFLAIAMSLNPLTYAVDATPLTLMYEATADTGKTSGQTASAPTDFDAATSPIVYGNVHFNHSKLPDGNVPLKLERFVLPDGETSRLIAFTARNIYYYDEVNTSWVLINPLVDPLNTTGDQMVFTTSDYWDTCRYGGYICATNGQDVPIKWNGLADEDTGFVGFSNIDTRIDNDAEGQYISSAKFIASYFNYLLLANVEINGVAFGNQDYVYWSGIGDGVSEGGFVIGGYVVDGTPVVGNSTDASYMIISGNGEISGGMALYRGMLMIFKRYSIRKVWFNGSQIPFSQDEQNPDVGCFAPGSVIHDKEGNLFFFGSDKLFREISIGSISDGIPVTARNINTKLTPKIASAYIIEYNELWWAVPSGSIGTGATELTGNNYVLCFGRGKWTVRDMPVVAFGEYVYQLNYDYASLPYQDYESWDWEQYDMPQDAESIVDIVSDADGYLYSSHASYTDVGVQYESFFTLSTDMANKQALAYKKRILQMYLYFDITESNDTIVTVSYKRDTETDWVNAGSVTLSSNQKIVRKRLACDIRGGTFQFKISSFNPFRFIGIEFDYNFAGER